MMRPVQRTMQLGRIRTTSALVTAALALGLAIGPGCGASAKEVRRARGSGYQADFALVYTEVLQAVRRLYPQLVEDAKAGVIRTSWHPLKLSPSGTTDGLTAQQRDQLRNQQTTDPSMQSGALSESTMQQTRYFVRFDIHVLGGKPWRVEIHGQASAWELGAVPTELKGADEPHWLKGRVDALYVDIYNRLKKYAVPLPEEATAQPVAAPKADLSKYGNLPEGAAKVIDEVAAAAKSHSYDVLRAAMSDDFTWSLGGDPSADQALVMWQADSTSLAALAAALEAGCARANATTIACPVAAVSDGYTGDRVRFELVGDVWKMRSFLRKE